MKGRLAPETVFELQDDLVPRIVLTVADQYGVLVRSMSESLRGRSADEDSPQDAVLRAFSYHQRITPEDTRKSPRDSRSGDCSRARPQRLPRRAVLHLWTVPYSVTTPGPIRWAAPMRPRNEQLHPYRPNPLRPLCPRAPAPPERFPRLPTRSRARPCPHMDSSTAALLGEQ